MELIRTYRQLHFKQWLYLLGFWLFIALFISTQLFFNGLKNGVDSSWWVIFRDQIPIWSMWVLITPFVLWLINRFPLQEPGILKALIIYIAVGICLLFVLSNVTLVYLLLSHGYIDLSNTNLTEYAPYFFSRMTNDALIFVFLMAIALSTRAYGLRKEAELKATLAALKNDQLRNELNQAHLQALKLQLNPHFLFNTLHTIAALTLIGENKTSAHITTRLGDFLRRTLDFEEHQMVSLARELEFFDLYMAIEASRFKDRLEIEKQVDKACLSCQVPNLILQPLAENAIKHGISRCKGKGMVSLRVALTDGFIKIQLYNDGPLLNLPIGPGIGLSNVQKRLDRLYEGEHKFQLENDKNGQGVNSILTLPLQTYA